MKNVLKIITVLISCTVMSCIEKKPSDVNETALSDSIDNVGFDVSLLDNAKVLVTDSTDSRFDRFTDANVMLVYKDSILITCNSNPQYGEPLISLYDMNNNMCRLANYIPHGSDFGEMVACRIALNGDELFVNDCFYSKRYSAICLGKPLIPSYELHLSNSGVEERGVAAVPFRQGLLVENPQCYVNDEANIHQDDVPRLLYYEQGKCLTKKEKVDFNVAEVNTGADIHYNASRHRICFVSHLQPFVEFYDDSLRLENHLSLQSDDCQKIYVEEPQPVMRQMNNHGEIDANVTFEKTRRVVRAGSQFHAFLCSAADEEHIYLAYCGKLFGGDYHTYPTYIIVLNWNGKVIDTYRFGRWIQAISPSSKTGEFYLTVYADDESTSSRMKLVKAVPRL